VPFHTRWALASVSAASVQLCCHQSGLLASRGEAFYAPDMSDITQRARVQDVHELAGGMPHVTVERGSGENPVYQVGGKSFVFFRTPRPDAVDPETGERYADVIVFWVPSEDDKQALVRDEGSPFFTTAHFKGHPSVLLRASRIGELTRQELAEVIHDAWLSRVSARRAAAWLNARAAESADASTKGGEGEQDASE